jgi:transcriptional regulator with PAS, ATPase and Fis domain
MQRHREYARLIGVSDRIAELRSEIENIALSDAKVLITGESGSGKEVVARQIHAHSSRASKPFVAINCAGIPESLLESELFGHVKGSFTGAYRDRSGRLEMAAGGTMFLDEIGEMSLRMQGSLLRFLETGEIEKVGAERVTRVESVRVISATNRKLRDRIAEGLFREDLYYRLDVISVTVPPLCEHREDIPVLVDHFVREAVEHLANQQNGPQLHVPVISPEVMSALIAYPWPGNVRELQNVVERLMVVSRSGVIEVRHLSPNIRAAGPLPQIAHVPEARPTVADDLFNQLVIDGKPFWTTVYAMYMRRDIARKDMRDLVHRGLEEARGNYRILLRLFNMESRDYKRFLNFLRKHDCRLPFRNYRRANSNRSCPVSPVSVACSSPMRENR